MYSIVRCGATFTTPNCNFGDQIIWNNSFIKVDNTTIYYQRFHRAGITHVNDLFNENGTPVNYNQFMYKFNLARFPFTLLAGLISAVPLEWKWQGRGRSILLVMITSLIIC